MSRIASKMQFAARYAGLKPDWKMKHWNPCKMPGFNNKFPSSLLACLKSPQFTKQTLLSSAPLLSPQEQQPLRYLFRFSRGWTSASTMKTPNLTNDSGDSSFPSLSSQHSLCSSFCVLLWHICYLAPSQKGSLDLLSWHLGAVGFKCTAKCLH